LYRTHASPRRRAFGSRARRRPIAARVVVVVVVVRARVVVVARAVIVVVIVVIVVVIAVRVVVVARRAPRSRAASRDAPPIADARAVLTTFDGRFRASCTRRATTRDRVLRTIS